MSGFWVIKLTRRRLIFGLLTVLCMAVIFCFSLDNAELSAKKSGEVTESIVKVVVDDYNELPVKKQMSIMDKAHHIVRKMAHFIIYTMLGFLASLTIGKRKLLSLGSLWTLVFCFLYACSDEIHQHFVPGRACMFTDVLIDTSGAALGMILSLMCIYIVGFISDRRRKKGSAQ